MRNYTVKLTGSADQQRRAQFYATHGPGGSRYPRTYRGPNAKFLAQTSRARLKANGISSKVV